MSVVESSSEYERAGIDMASTYAADSYLEQNAIVDPWAQQCFVNVVDSIIDYAEVVLPQATRHSIEHTDTGNLPEIVLRLRQAGAITPLIRRVAEEIAPDINSLQSAFREFRVLAFKERDRLRSWLQFHQKSRIREHHPFHVPSGVQSFVAEFWSSTPEPVRLSEETVIQSDELKYAFDIFYRGQQYDEILSSVHGTYFNHPLRATLFSQRAKFETVVANRHSWGRLLDQLMKDGKIGRDVGEISDILLKIRSEVQRLDATWYRLREIARQKPDEANDRLKMVASSVGLPAKLTAGAASRIKDSAEFIGLAIDASISSPGLANFLLSKGVAALRMEERYVPGTVGRIRLLRGAMTWPGLL